MNCKLLNFVMKAAIETALRHFFSQNAVFVITKSCLCALLFWLVGGCRNISHSSLDSELTCLM